MVNYQPDYPLGKINLYPIPESATKIHFLTFKKLKHIEYEDDDIELPPGYDRALTYNLAVELAPEFGAIVPESVSRLAMESLASVKRRNIKPSTLQTEVSQMTEISDRGFSIMKG